MRRNVVLAALVLAGVLADRSAEAANSFTFTVTPTLAFPGANPTTQPTIPGSAPVVATITIRNPNHENFTISVMALGATLASAGGDTIPVGNVTWTATASFVVSGGNAQGQAASITATSGTQTLSTTAVNSATGHDGRRTSNTDTYIGTVTHLFFLANSWLYSTGSYTQTIRFTFTTV